MIELERHIEILLLSNDCVIVPGFGGFTANHTPAMYDDRDGLFLPPLRTLGFNTRLDKNDFLLVQSYAEAYDISYPEACARIENDINEIRQQINNNGSYELNDIGVLYLNDNGNLMFSPCEAGLLTPQLYGLGSFEMERDAMQYSQEEKHSDNVNDNDDVVSVSVNTSPFDEQHEEIPLQHAKQETNDDTASGDKVLHIKFSTLRNVLICLITFLILFAVAIPVNKNNPVNVCNIDNGFFKHLFTDGLDKIKNQKAVKLNNDKQKTETPEKTDIPETITENNTGQQTKTQEDFFCLVLASKVSKKNAESFVCQLKNEGFEQTRVLTENKSIKVIYGSFKSLNEAYNTLNRLKNNMYFYDAWVYQVKN
ncbi:MAG: SPOR domain-containing protein [Prevotella sp.]|nr:SPOR domain-containing protein [Prevotella sp.]